MKTITVSASQRYDIFIGKGNLDSCGEIIHPLTKATKAVIVSDSNVAPLYLERVKTSVEKTGIKTEAFVFEAGEQSKCHTTLLRLYDFLSMSSITRNDIVIALGGGVTGDLTGFAAATFLRGIDYVQIPTSLLAMTDSSVGGKTAVDTPMGKNLVGAFKQPLCVICDTDTLKTLPHKFFVDGMGEVIKYSMIKSRSLYDILLDKDIESVLEEVIAECVTIKKDIVEKDEFDKGERMLLNFGHTLGHSIEKYYNYTGITHGSAVAVGMYLMTEVSEKNGDTQKGTLEKLSLLLEKYGLLKGCNVPFDRLLDGCLVDKKRQNDYINIVVSSEVGKSIIKKLSIKQFYKYMEIINE